jgi:NAD(P)-dependent dehydrogenase (short-subunit alcohol dehydrogenase family)
LDIRDSRILILGGSGLVGMAIARELLPLRPRALVISALTQREAEEGVDELRRIAPESVEVAGEWGNLFVPAALKDERRDTLLDDPAARAAMLDELYGPLGEEALARSALGDLVLRHRPDAVIDCINTATGFAYQNVFKSAGTLREAARRGPVDLETIEKHLATITLPHLIHHVWVALHSMQAVGTRVYLKIGTAGTGGMGLNIPFTHSEDRPSRQLLSKSAVAGAHTLLLYLMARTPGAPAVKEIKPTAAISWKGIRSGDVVWRGAPITRVDAVAPVSVSDAFVPPAEPGKNGERRQARKEFGRDTLWRDTGQVLRGVYLDSGENGLFSPDEFEAITSLGLMEFITPEEIARDAVREMLGQPTGHDVVAALDASTSGPTYRAGVLRQSALAYMEELERDADGRSVGFEMLGPPRLTKLLFEGEVLRRMCDGRLESAAQLDPETAARDAEALVKSDADLRTRMLSANLAILLSDGEHLLRGRKVEIEPAPGETVDDTAWKGWVDLRAENWEAWRDRVVSVLARVAGEPGADDGSQWDIEPWHRERTIRPGALAAWIFRHEDEGERIKR